MNAEQKLNEKLSHPDYLVTAGSHLYGTATSESDIDLRGFLVEPFEYIAGMRNFECYQPRQDKDDIVIYSLKKFINLLLRGDPVCLEMLFAPRWAVQKQTMAGATIVYHRELFLSRQFIKRVLGYSESEFRKVQGVTLKPIKRKQSEEQIINSIRNTFKLPKQEMDDVIKLLFSQHEKHIVKTTRKLGEKRKKQIEKYGFCTNSASHTIRLLSQLLEFIQDMTITFPRPNSKFLSDIKLGKIDFTTIVSTRQELVELINKALEKTQLSEKPKIKEIYQLYHSIIKSSLLDEFR